MFNERDVLRVRDGGGDGKYGRLKHTEMLCTHKAWGPLESKSILPLHAGIPLDS